MTAELVVVVPCSGAKLDHRAPAEQLYVGSYHRAAMRAAEALGGRVLILSGRYGLVRPTTILDPYAQRIDQPGAVAPELLARQARVLGLAAARVVVLAGRAYADALRAVVPDLEWPLDGARGIGDHLATFARIARDGALEGTA